MSKIKHNIKEISILFIISLFICLSIYFLITTIIQKNNEHRVKQARISTIEDPENSYIGEKDNLFAVENGKYINSNGKIIFTLPAKYNIIGEFNEGYMLVGEYIDIVKLGDPKNQYKEYYPLGIITKFSIVNNNGEITRLAGEYILPCDNMGGLSIDIPLYHNGIIILINIDGKLIAYDKNGNIVKSSNIFKLQEDDRIIEDIEKTLNNGINTPTGRCYLKTKQGNIVQEMQGTVLSNYTENSFAIGSIVYNKNYLNLIINKLIYPLTLVGNKFGIEKLSNLYFDETTTTDKIRYIDKNGKVFLNTNYHTLYHYGTDIVSNYDAGFYNGLALLKDEKGNYVYINKNGIPIIELKTKNCYPNNFRGKLAFIYYENENKGVYINYKGNEIYEEGSTTDRTPLKIDIDYENVNKYINVPPIDDTTYKKIFKYKSTQSLD